MTVGQKLVPVAHALPAERVALCARSKSSGGGGGIVGKISNKLGAKNNSGFQRFDDGVEMQNGKGGLGGHM